MPAAETSDPTTICRPTSSPIPVRRPTPPAPSVPDGYAAPYTMLRRLSRAHHGDRRYPQPRLTGRDVVFTSADGELSRLAATGVTVEATIGGHSTRRLSLLDTPITVAVTDVRTVITCRDERNAESLMGGHILHDWVATVAADRHEGRVILSNELTLGVYSGGALLTTTIDLADGHDAPSIARDLLTTIATRRLRSATPHLDAASSPTDPALINPSLKNPSLKNPSLKNPSLKNVDRHRLGELASGLEPLTRTVEVPGHVSVPS